MENRIPEAGILVGVGKASDNIIFQVLMDNPIAIHRQSKQHPNAVQAATALTPLIASSLKILGLPLGQVRSEVYPILRGTIAQGTELAKYLGLTNEIVAQWKVQGVLVDRLLHRLAIFTSGNSVENLPLDPPLS